MGTSELSLLVSGEHLGGEGLDRRAAREIGEGAFSIRSERGMVDMVVVWMITGICVVVFWMALGCLL